MENESKVREMEPVPEIRLPEVDIEKVREVVERRKKVKAAYTAALMQTFEVDPVIGIKLRDGEIYRLEFTLAACRKVQVDTGKNPAKGEIEYSDLEDWDLVVKLLFYGLQTHNRDKFPTIESLEDNLSIRRGAYYVDSLLNALDPILPDQATVQQALLEPGSEEEEPRAPFPVESGGTGFTD